MLKVKLSNYVEKVHSLQSEIRTLPKMFEPSNCSNRLFVVKMTSNNRFHTMILRFQNELERILPGRLCQNVGSIAIYIMECSPAQRIE